MEIIIISRFSWKPGNPRQLSITGPNNLGIPILITRILSSYQIINQSRKLLDNSSFKWMIHLQVSVAQSQKFHNE